jgi:phosphocarrier protein
MLQKDFIIKNKTGLHARPASAFVKTANTFKCDIRLQKDDQAIDAKSIISLLTLGAGQGARLTITTDGEDEEVAMKVLLLLLESFDD